MKKQCDPEPRGWRKITSRFLDLLYPPQCAVCCEPLAAGNSLCGPCKADLPRLTAPFCESCGEMFPGKIDGPFECPNCRDLSFAFEFARPALVRDPRTLDLIHRLKYSREIHLALELGRLAGEAFGDPRLKPALEEGWPLIPVPLHRRRMQRRHFNQAEEIARVLSRQTGLPLLRGLQRKRPTHTQTLLTRKQRLENLRGAFETSRAARRWIATAPQGAVLIDDVLTTGSTVHECAKVLRRAGLRKVVVVTVMRG